MTRTTLSGLATVAMLAVLASAPAKAQGFGQRYGAPTGYGGGLNQAIGNRGAPSIPQRAKKLTSGQPSPSANTAANVHALTVYLQWRKCLDNMLPQCP